MVSEQSSWGKRALQLEGREGGEDYCLSPVGGAGPSLGGRQAWGGETGVHRTSARTTDRRLRRHRLLKRAPSAARTCSSRRGLARPGQQEAAAPALWPAPSMAAGGGRPDAADRKGGRREAATGRPRHRTGRGSVFAEKAGSRLVSERRSLITDCRPYTGA